MLKSSSLNPATKKADRFARLVSGWLAPVVLVAAVALLAAVVARSATDLNAVREAARQGTLDAFTQMGMSAPPSLSSETEQSATTLPGAPEIGFQLRAANRLGHPNAPVTIIEFADFRCPYCAAFSAETAPALIGEYVETGKVQIVFKHFAILGSDSVRAAQAAECAADQGAFWLYHDALYSLEAFDDASLIALADDLGLDAARFETCLKSDETLARVEADKQEAIDAGLQGTPSFFVNGQPLFGAQPIEAFREMIDAQQP
jgi:protein-disulfide isomerase